MLFYLPHCLRAEDAGGVLALEGCAEHLQVTVRTRVVVEVDRAQTIAAAGSVDLLALSCRKSMVPIVLHRRNRAPSDFSVVANQMMRGELYLVSIIVAQPRIKPPVGRSVASIRLPKVPARRRVKLAMRLCES